MVGSIGVGRTGNGSVRLRTPPPGYGWAPYGGISAGAFAAFWLRLDKDSKRLLAASLVLALVMNLCPSGHCRFRYGR